MPTMLFSDLYKSPKSTFSKLRHPHTQPPLSAQAGCPYDADLVSRDKARQKEAVRRYLSEKVCDDWHFDWPPVPSTSPASPLQHSSATAGPLPSISPELERDDNEVAPELVDRPPPAALASASNNADADSGAQADSETDSIYSTVSEDQLHYQSRLEWTSDLSTEDLPAASPSPFRFDSPESIGAAVQASTNSRRARRRRQARAETEWNVGLACFNARRDAWTGARTARVKPKLTLPTSPTSPRRSLWRLHSHSKLESSAPPTATTLNPPGPVSPLSPVTSNSRHSQQSAPDMTTPLTSDGDSHESTQLACRSRREYPVETLVPIPPPLLPPANPMRASISPAIYTSLYDKVVVHSLQPSCPVNLVDMTRSCVAGWKRDGEWPPRPAEIPQAGAVAVVRKKQKDEVQARERRDSIAAATALGRRMSLGAFLGRGVGEAEKEQDEAAQGKGIRRSIQRVLGLAHGNPTPTGTVTALAREEARPA